MNIEIRKSNQIVCHGDDPVADITLHTPLFSGERMAKRLTKYYAKADISLLEFLKNIPTALSAAVEVKSNVTYNSGNILSFYRDVYVGSNYVRIADTWKNGYPVGLKALGAKRKELLAMCMDEADILNRSGYISLFPNYQVLIRRLFDPKNFYIHAGKPVIFYQPGILAGKSYGIIKFELKTQLLPEEAAQDVTSSA